MPDATEKKYVSLDGLTYYDTKIKKFIGDSDTTTLGSAKSYADGLAKNYDAAGAAATALADAKDYADGKDTAIAAAKKAGEDAKTAAEAAKSAAETADGKADVAKDAVDKLKTFVGTLPEGETSASVVAYIDKKTAGIASESALASLTTRVTTAEGKITTAEGEIDTLQTKMTSAEGKVDTLIGEDKTDIGKSVRTIANEELTKQLIPDNAAESLNTLQEIAAWIQAHPGDASAMNSAIAALQTLVGTLPEGITATTVVGYVAELVAAEKTRATSAEEALGGRIGALEASVGTGGAIETKITTAKKEAINTAAGDATTKAEKALADANSYTNTEIGKVNTALAGKATQTALDDVSGRVTTAEGEIDALQVASHTHKNKADLDGISATLIAQWNDAHENAHTHTNKEVLDGITSEKITAWDSAEQKAKAYTDTKIGEFTPIADADIDKMFA